MGPSRPGEMMQALFYDRDGRPVSRQRWQQLGRQPGYSRVGYADAIRHGQQVTVITFWSGIAGDGRDGPLIFCTCAGIRGPGDRRAAHQRLWGWPDVAAARAGHQAVTAWIAGLADFLAGHTNQLPAPDPALPGTPPRVTVVCARPQTRQLLQLTGLDRTLRLARTRAEAIQALPAAPDPAARAARPPRPVPAPIGGDDDDAG